MSTHLIETNTIHCDGCDDVYADCVPTSAPAITLCAVRAGWECLETELVDVDLCPACLAKLKEVSSAGT